MIILDSIMFIPYNNILIFLFNTVKVLNDITTGGYLKMFWS